MGLRNLITVSNYSRTKFFFIALAVLVIYSYGWRVTEINLGDFFRDFHLVKPLVKELVQPDLFSRAKKSQTKEIEFFLKADSNNNQTSSGLNEKRQLVLSQSSGQIGDRLTISGRRLKPNSAGTLFWVNEIEQEFPLGKFKTDSTGKFHKDITVPPSARGNRQIVKAIVSWPEGSLQVSETLRLTFDKMVETLFLALMATTFAILIAVPLSLLASRNLMTENSSGNDGLLCHAYNTKFAAVCRTLNYGDLVRGLGWHRSFRRSFSSRNSFHCLLGKTFF